MLKVLKNLDKKDYLMFALSVILIIIQVWLDLKLPDYMSKITILIQTEGSTLGEILKEGAYMLSCALGSLLSSMLVGYLASKVAASFSYNTRAKIFNKTLAFSTEEMKKFSTSSLITRTTNDVTQIEMFVSMGLQMMVKSPIMAVWAITKILGKSLELSALTGACVVILLATVITLMVIVLPRFEKVQKLIDRINSVMREHLTGIRVIRAFNAEKYQENRFDKANDDLTNMQMFNQRAFSIMGPMMNLVMHSLTLGIYFIGSFIIERSLMYDKLTFFSNMVVFSSYGMQVIMSFLMLAMIFMMWPRAKVSAVRINEVLDASLSIKDGSYNIDKSNEKGTVEFKNVSFKYPDADEYLLENISFRIKQGETAAFIGSTGSGKSTLINLVPRFYDVTCGEVLIDGVNVKDYKLSLLHNKIGYVPQKAVMFTGTVSSNVAYGDNGRNITEDKIKEAIKIAQGEDFVLKMSNTYNAHIARGGTNISGGQKQRLSIARALVRKPEIYIFDDSFSALDYKTDKILREELKKYTKNATSLIVAQRIGTIMNADKIIVLDKGKCVGIGTHKELLKTCEVYKEIALSQLTKEEIENA